MPEWTGICGSSRRRCQLVWSSKFPTTYVGTYPEKLLPARRTIWHAASDGGYNFRAPLTSLGNSGTGLGLVDMFSGMGMFGSDIQSDVFTPESQVVLIFAQTANRLNVTHILTPQEIASMNPTTGIGFIDVGEYVFDGLAATFEPANVTVALTPEEQKELEKSGLSVNDALFRKLWELEFPGNRYQYVQNNVRGVEYRLDNGGPKSQPIFGFGSFADFSSASYRDGSSRILAIDLKTAFKFKDAERPPRAGDTIYLTYIAVKQPYFRDVVVVKWNMMAISLPPECIPMTRTVKAARYRFYEWTVKGDGPNASPVKLGGWRAVEAQGMPVTTCSILGTDTGNELGDVFGDQSGLLTIPYLPVENLTAATLDGYIANKATLPKYEVNATSKAGSISYHKNSGSKNSPNAYKNSLWYRRVNYDGFGYGDLGHLQQHVYFNVHPKALQKRDVDKFGIEKWLANEVETDIKAGVDTLFPFMDDPKVNVPVQQAGCVEYLSSSNCTFNPVKPSSTNFEGEFNCGVAGGAVIGNFSGGYGDVLAVFTIESPIIQEPMAKETRVLVERHFTYGEHGIRIVAIEGTAGADVQSLTCVGDALRSRSMVIFPNSDSELRVHTFWNEDVIEGFQSLSYRPDKGFPDTTKEEPTPEDYEALIGYAGTLGDIPGYSVGRSISLSTYAPIDSFIYRTDQPSWVARSLNTAEEDLGDLIQDLSFEDNKIKFEESVVGRLELIYELTGDEPTEVTVVVRKSDKTELVIDSVHLPLGIDIMKLDLGWVEADEIKIVGTDRITLKSAIVMCLGEDAAKVFLDKQSSTKEEAGLAKIDRLKYRGVKVKSDVVSAGQNHTGRIFVLFNDSDSGISCMESDNKGETWSFQYGLIQKVGDNGSRDPFLLDRAGADSSFVFYTYKGKLICEALAYSDLQLEDSMIVERFYDDIYTPATDKDKAKEKLGIYTSPGRLVRYRRSGSVVAGDLSDKDFLLMTGRDVEAGKFDYMEDRIAEVLQSGGTVKESEVKAQKYPFFIGPSSAFANQDVNSIFYSAYQTDESTLYVFFMGKGSGEIPTLQCHFSSDSGNSWYDLWEFLHYGRNRLRCDDKKHTQYIDYGADGGVPKDPRGTDPMKPSNYPFGLNLHWSRMKEDKKEGAKSYMDESKVIEINAPYAFRQPSTGTVFLFYVYKDCLLCKMFNDSIFMEAAKDISKGYEYVRKLIEEQSRSWFIDGYLDKDELREEIHGYLNDETKEEMAQGNILFPFPTTVATFKEERAIAPQRVCAHELSNGSVRVFYRIKDSNKVRAAIWTGNSWYIEELLADMDPMPKPEVKNYTGVTGGFGTNKF